MADVKYHVRFANNSSYYLKGMKDYFDKVEPCNDLGVMSPEGGFIVGTAGRVKFVIDSLDADVIKYNHLLNWSDVYFKTHMSVKKEYPDKVKPIINASPRQANEHLIGHMVNRLRGNPKDIDVSFNSQIWAGKNHVISILEQLHSLRSDLKMNLRVFLTNKQKTIPIEENPLAQRVHKLGYDCYKAAMTEFLTAYGEFARSKLVVLRHGKHMCQSWGWIDHFAIGSCIVLDQHPDPVFPVPLIENKNYLNLDLDKNNQDSYNTIPSKMRKFLKDENLMEEIRRNNMAYYDDHMHYSRTGKHIYDIISTIRG